MNGRMLLWRWMVALVCLLVAGVARADEAAVERYILAEAGTVPIILSAPHGGGEEIADVPRRTGEGVNQFVTVRDVRTFELAQALADAIEREMGGRPYVVLARFRRTQIDANRDATGAYESPEAAAYYEAYHAVIERFGDEIEEKWGSGLLLDIHGQARSPETIYRGTRSGRTVSSLLERHGVAALEGPGSLMGILADKGYTVAPPPAAEGQGPATETRFTGGHIVVAHGSGDGGTIDAIQLEFGSALRARTKLQQTAADVAEAIRVFSEHFGPDAAEPAAQTAEE